MKENDHERAIREWLSRRDDLFALEERFRSAALERGVDYDLGEGRRVPIDLMPTPAVLNGSQVRFLRRLSQAVNRMMQRMPDLYREDPAVRALLPFLPEEAEWIADCHRPKTPQPLVSRIDIDLPNHEADGERVAVAFEPNGVSIGGLYYAREGSRIVSDFALAGAPFYEFRPLDDPCVQAARLFRRHARALGLGPRPRVVILENREWDQGITEMPRLAATLDRMGIPAVLADPRHLATDRGRLVVDGTPVDLVYRNMELRDLVEIEAAGEPLPALREAFRRNLVISALAGDFDHKSLWEVLTSDATRHVVPRSFRPLFRRHLLWTRLLRDARVEGPDGSAVDLIPFVLSNRPRLVLKPNRSCGGDGVTLGPFVSDAEWEDAVQEALSNPCGWVVQAFHAASTKPFLRVKDGRTTLDDVFFSFGVIAMDDAVGILGRTSSRPVVNVSIGGGLLAVFRSD